jgi:SNF2 family DNA or RNA helicase
MEIINNTHLSVRTRNPNKIIDAIPSSITVQQEKDIYTVQVPWELREAQQLCKLKLKNIPSPILRDYGWPGLYQPMEHQRTTAEFLTLHTRGFCFNEQGTGKTASAIWASDYLLTQKYIKRVLVVCPLSIMQAAWQRDLFQFAIHRSVGVAHGSREKRQQVIAGDYEYVIINFDGIEIVHKEIQAGGFDLIIIDEANAYKTATTNRWKAMQKLIKNNTWLWMMTGTPAAQSPVDAFGLGKLCVPANMPTFVGSWRDTVMYKLRAFTYTPKPDAAERVHNALQPAIRFTKADCLDLPDVTYVDREAPLTPQQKKYYDLIRKESLMIAGEEEVTAANAAVRINKLLQISGGAVYASSGATLEFDVSNRLEAVREIIDEASAKVLVFVPFTHTIDLLKTYLEKKHIPCEVISGDVSATKRNDIIQRFQSKDDKDLKALIIQPAAAAHGITLTAANVVVWYAPVTSTEIYLQANARIDRHGQKNPMTVVHIVGSPVEEKLYRNLRGKLEEHTHVMDLYEEVMRG